MGNYFGGAGIAQSVYRITTGWAVHGSDRVGAIFHNISDGPWCSFNGYQGSSPWLNKPGVVLGHPPQLEPLLPRLRQKNVKGDLHVMTARDRSVVIFKLKSKKLQFAAE
jgi:hypothetical protein